MCAGNDHSHGPTASGVDEWFVESEAARRFVAAARATADAQPDRARAAEALRPAFAALLADQHWLPASFAQPYAASGMGGGIGQYLLFRAGDGSLSLFSLVVPAGSATPVHDHLAWGLIGLYQGRQAEEVYARRDDGRRERYADLELVERREVETGQFYALLPPDGDIHRVRTISPEPSISIHLLGNDTGCVWRHAYEPETRSARPFRSGYSNRPCPDGDA
jgi:predicted metal-dependent enzyme (double-stranded beta helix superfamily)